MSFLHLKIDYYLIWNTPVVLGCLPCRLTHFKWKMIACTKRWDKITIMNFTSTSTSTCWKHSTSLLCWHASSELQFEEDRCDEADVRQVYFCAKTAEFMIASSDTFVAGLIILYFYFSSYLGGWCYNCIICLDPCNIFSRLLVNMLFC